MKPKAITNASEAASQILPAFPRKLFNKQECFVSMPLDSRNACIGKPYVVAIGTVNSVSIHPRDVFREAIKRNATSLILGHNHPSGSLDVSMDDIALTKKMLSVGELLGISVLDHIILTTGNKYKSLRETNSDLWVGKE